LRFVIPTPIFTIRLDLDLKDQLREEVARRRETGQRSTMSSVIHELVIDGLSKPHARSTWSRLTALARLNAA